MAAPEAVGDPDGGRNAARNELDHTRPGSAASHSDATHPSRARSSGKGRTSRPGVSRGLGPGRGRVGCKGDWVAGPLLPSRAGLQLLPPAHTRLAVLVDGLSRTREEGGISFFSLTPFFSRQTSASASTEEKMLWRTRLSVRDRLLMCTPARQLTEKQKMRVGSLFPFPACAKAFAVGFASASGVAVYTFNNQLQAGLATIAQQVC